MFNPSLIRDYSMPGEDIGGAEWRERLYQVLTEELDEGDYKCATLTMQWIQKHTKLRLSTYIAAVVMLEFADNFRLERVNWSEVEYV